MLAGVVIAQSMWLMDNAARLGGLLLVAAGVYHLSPLKRVCLVKRQTPLFILTAWRDGRGGAFRMGLEHGLARLGCCWLLFLILFLLGMMNVSAMAFITALIFAEKSLPIGWQIGQAAGLLLVYDLLAMIWPDRPPTAAMAMAARPDSGF